jgi:TPR repeat protein
MDPVRVFVSVALLLAVCLQTVVPQERADSPVFKSHRPVRPSLVTERSDATYQLWQTFLLTQKANAGDALAAYELSIRYLTGSGTQVDTLRGAYWTRKAAAKNVIPARFNLGILTYNSWGTPWNPFESYQHFKYCAEQGMEEAQYIMGQFLSDNLVVPRNWGEAFQWVKKSADAGYEPARNMLPEFEKRALASSAANEGNRLSEAGSGSPGLVFLDFTEDTVAARSEQTLLREVLRYAGRDVRSLESVTDSSTDSVIIDSATIATLNRVGDAGSPEALAILGRCYERGIVVPKDMVQAASYYVRAIKHDSQDAPELLWDLAQAPGFARQLKTRASAGDLDAQYAWVGLVGLGFDVHLAQAQVVITPDQALQMLSKAALQEHTPSLVELALLYYSARWVERDPMRAEALLSQAAQLGSREATVRLAVLTVQSLVDSLEIHHALNVLQDASADGSLLAQVALGYCYEHGVGVPQDKAEAAKVYRKSAYRGSQDGLRALRRMHDEIRPPLDEFVIRE